MTATINSFRGDSIPVSKVVNVTPVAPIATAQTFTIWCNGKPVAYTAALGDGVSGVINGLINALGATTIPEFQEFTASQNAGALVLTAKTPGTPFDVTATSSGNVTVAETTAGQSATNEVHELQLLGTYTAGTFTVTYNFGAGNVTTGAIAYNATAATVQTALAALTGVGAGNVAVTGGPGPSSPWFISWIGTFTGTSVTPGTVNGSGLTGAGTVTITTQQDGAANSDCIQQIDISAAYGGTFTLTFQGQTTSALAYNITPSALQSALQALSSIGSGNALVVGNQNTPSYNSPGHLVRFTSALGATSLATMSINTTLLSGPANVNLIQQGGATTAKGIQFVDLALSTGTFTITYNGSTTAAIPINPAGGAGSMYFAVQSALQAITTDLVSVIGGQWLSNVPGMGFGLVLASHSPAAVPTVTVASSNSAVVTVLQNGLAHQNEIQQVWVAASGGTFTLTLGAQTTSAIAYNASTGTMQTRIQTDLSTTITSCTVSGSGTSAAPWIITVTSPANTNIAQMTGNGASLTGSGQITEVTAGQAGTNEVQTITEASGTSGGTFTLSFNGPTTPPILYNATAAQIQAALRALSTINTVTVSGSTGGPYTVTWSGTQGSAKQNLLIADGSQLTGATTSLITIATATPSSGPNHYDDPTNWTLGHVPNTLEEVLFDLGSSDCLYGLNQIAVVTANASTDTVTWALLAGGSAGNGATAGSFQANQTVYFTNAGGGLPGGISAGTAYYLVNVNRDNGTAQLATSAGGTPLDITTAGTGTHTMGARVASIVQTERFGGAIGLARQNSNGYIEYRPRYLHIGLATIGQTGLQTVTIGQDTGTGAGKTQIDNDVDAAFWTIIQSGGSNDSEARDVMLKGSNTSNTLSLIAGDVAVALFEGESAALASITQRGGTLELGPGVTVTGPITRTSGTLIVNGATLNGVCTL